VTGVTPALPADFERLRGVVLQDWTDATMADLRTAAVREMEKKYIVRHEAVAPTPPLRAAQATQATQAAPK
ncbi:MAG: hypothetical protein WAQ05_13320, partial [Rubrivivax sp.]